MLFGGRYPHHARNLSAAYPSPFRHRDSRRFFVISTVWGPGRAAAKDRQVPAELPGRLRAHLERSGQTRLEGCCSN